MKTKEMLIAVVLLSSALAGVAYAQGWSRLGDGLPAFYAIFANDSGSCWFAGDEGLVVHTTLDTLGDGYYNSWFYPAGPTQVEMSAVFSRSRSIAYVGTSDGSMYKTTDGGKSWKKVYSYTGPGQTYIDGIFFWNANVGVAYGDPPLYPNQSKFVVIRTTDGGSTWTPDTNGLQLIANQYGYEMDYDIVGNSFYFATMANFSDTTAQRYIIHSSDRGLTWSSTPVPRSMGNVNCAFSDSLNGILVSYNGDVASTTNGGLTWNLQGSDADIYPPVACLHGTQVYWAEGSFSSDSGHAIMKSTDGGKTWVTTGHSQSDLAGFSIVNGEYLWACGLDYAILRNDEGSQSPTLVQRGPGQGAGAEDFSLLQNYPNPFNPSTTIKYRLPSSEAVTVRIFDVLGREVRVLVNNHQSQGWHQVRWNGMNDSHAAVSTGVYFYQIHYGSLTETRKMLLLK